MFKRFLLIYLGCAAVLTLLLFMFAHYDEKMRVAQLATSELRYVGVARERAEKDFEAAEGDLRIIANMDEMRQYVNTGDSQHADRVADYFLLLARGRQHYNQLRYLDERGQEIIRVNFSEGKPVLVAEKELLNKSSYYYFHNTMQLTRDEIFVSPLDLNVEHHQVEVPYRPVIRFATPVFDSAGRRKGVVVLNYIADEMLQHFQLAMQGSVSGGGMLLNRDGYWLSSPHHDDEWGFMLGKKELTFGHDYPDAWQAISSQESGTLRTAQGLFAFATARPLMFDEHPTMDPSRIDQPEQYKRYAVGYNWKVVSVVPQDVISAGAFFNKPGGQLLSLAAYFLLALGAFAVVISSERHKAAEYALQELALLPEMAPGPVMRVDKAGVICLANTACKELYSMDSIEGMSIFEAIPDLARTDFEEMFGPDENILQVETDIGDAHYFFVLRNDADNKYVFAYGADISPIKLLEEQVRQAQKMEVVGQLAGGIAHDFNTLLGVILGYSDMLRDTLPENSLGRKNIDAILNAGKRAKALVRQLMDFSRLGTNKQEPLQLAALVRESIKLLQPSLPETIIIQQDIREKTASIHGNAVQIGQVILNLCMNAADAMGEKQGVLQISLKESAVDASMAHARNVPAGAYMQLTIADNGCGMSKEILTHVFEPFFTTKEVGRGTGLGLAVVHGIVKSHGGFVVVESEPGKGTQFHVYLPKSRELWVRSGVTGA